MTPEERRRLLAALSETVLPADEGPGAAEARVGDYLERTVGKLSSQNRAKVESGLDLVDSMAAQSYGKPFESCGDEERSEVLWRLQRVPHRIARDFLTIIVDLTLEGFLCDPSYGGNHAGAGWLAVGYSPEPRR